MSSAAEKHVKRARDLRALSRSDNPHEAEIARIRYNDLVARHGLSEADLVESSTEYAQLPAGKDGNYRTELARVIALSRGVHARHSPRQGVAFVGFPEAAKDACALFHALVGIVEAHCEWPGPMARTSDGFLWRTCFWLGFIAAIERQLNPERQITQEALNKIVKKAVAPPLLQQAADALTDLGHRTGFDDAERFKENAYNAGLQLGQAVPAVPYRGKRG